ncbi:hypothetical protein K4B79_37745 [Streptomyces lincolnensis]|jgi:hypothetical protein|uniref:hypothetical protein n=1 Tax=Streptomyces lincolnensis TaxID=1915 RepID=UPI001E31E924|nr:hypothetical protein [Streptomyces lincolnensis]MCD7443940.1 hypothetical protein [Streptomyces lincolnensis]
MGPNDAQIVRVFSREPGAAIADTTLNPQKDGEIVLEAEAGRTLHAQQGAYRVTLVVRDVSDGSVIPVVGSGEVKGQFEQNGQGWEKPSQPFTFTLSSNVLSQHAGHLAQAYGSVLYTSTEPGATFAVSPMFMILP